MKRSILILPVGIIGIVLILLFKPKPPVPNEPVTTQRSIQTNKASVFEAKNILSETTTQTPPTTIAPVEAEKFLDATKAQNIAEWTNAIPNLKLLTHSRYNDSWIAEQKDPTKCPTLLLTGTKGNTMQYTARLTDIEVMDDHIRRVEIKGPMMDIEQLREFGNNLLQLIGKNNTEFNTWCDKVGNKWVDASLYDSGSSQVPNSNKFYGFQILNTFNNEKPWCVYFIITDR